MDTFAFSDKMPTDRVVRRAILARNMTDTGALCTAREFAALMDALFAHRAELGTGGSELELQMIYSWAERVRLDELMRDEVLAGSLFVDIDESEELVWGAIPTPAGASATAAAQALLAAYDGSIHSLAARDVMTVFVASRLEAGKRVTNQEISLIGEWVDEGLAKSALLDLVVQHAASMVSVGPDGGISVRIGSAVDRTAEDPAA